MAGGSRNSNTTTSSSTSSSSGGGGGGGVVGGTKETKEEQPALSDMAIRGNGAIVEYCRTSMAALAGSTAGLLGLTGFYGFGFYLFSVVGLWLLLMLKVRSDWQKYFISRKSLFTNGFLGALFTYILFWTFIYGMVHVY